VVVNPAGDPCIIAVPYQGTLNFASFFAPKRSALPLATNGTQESKIKKDSVSLRREKRKLSKSFA